MKFSYVGYDTGNEQMKIYFFFSSFNKFKATLQKLFLFVASISIIFEIKNPIYDARLTYK